MDKQIPIYFDSVVVSSPLQEISKENPNIGRLKVRAFTKYGNRNGSYITDQVANQLITSATNGQTPVIGFFDPETKSWASHTGPTLANAYGYVENFLGWEPFTDTDGISREYAVFSVILFTDYFEEAKNIVGQNQSMELDPASITGDWALIEDQEYYVYTTAKMLGFCVIGAHEPCFSVSAFFSKNDNNYKDQYDKFSTLLSDLKSRVEEARKGGEQPMEDFEVQETVQVSETVEQPEVQEPADTFEEESLPENEEQIEEQPAEEEPVNNEFEILQSQYNELQTINEQLQADIAAANSRIAEFEESQSQLTVEMDNLRKANEELQATIATYQAQTVAAENERKIELINKYSKILSSAEEIDEIKKSINDFSYDELNGKLAILFANQQMASNEEIVPLPEPAESQFALLMKKYRKN